MNNFKISYKSNSTNYFTDDQYNNIFNLFLPSVYIITIILLYINCLRNH